MTHFAPARLPGALFALASAADAWSLVAAADYASQVDLRYTALAVEQDYKVTQRRCRSCAAFVCDPGGNFRDHHYVRNRFAINTV